MTHMTGSLDTAMTLNNPWAVVPSLGHLDAYISAVNRMPMLTLEQEQEFARKLKNENDLKPPVSWCSRTCAWWSLSRANTWATVCPTAT